MLGAYLIFEGVKTFQDGRAELFLGGLFEKTHLSETASNDDDFLSLLNQYHVTWALTMRTSYGAQKLGRAKAWKQIYRDDYAQVFVKTQ